MARSDRTVLLGVRRPLATRDAFSLANLGRIDTMAAARTQAIPPLLARPASAEAACPGAFAADADGKVWAE